MTPALLVQWALAMGLAAGIAFIVGGLCALLWLVIRGDW